MRSETPTGEVPIQGDVVVTLEEVFLRDRAGTLWSSTTFGDSFWDRYLDVFTRVTIVGRLRDVVEAPDTAQHIASDRVRLHGVPFYRGPMGYAVRRHSVQAALKAAASLSGVHVLRLPGQLGFSIAAKLDRLSRRYAIELVGDPEEVFRGGGVGAGPLQPFLRWHFTRETKRIVANAGGVSYVTASTLQSKYPAGSNCVTSNYSSIVLPAEMIGGVSRPIRRAPGDPARLLLVGSLAQMYKGADTLIGAVEVLLARGHDVVAEIIGEGGYRRELEELAKQHVPGRVKFLGAVPRSVVLEHLDACDVFVLPSRTEGLPRAVIEAMARGVPCVSTNVGGLPELLDARMLAPPDNPGAIADIVERLLEDPKMVRQEMLRNRKHAAQFSAELLQERRRCFYSSIQSLARGGGSVRPAGAGAISG